MGIAIKGIKNLKSNLEKRIAQIATERISKRIEKSHGEISPGEKNNLNKQIEASLKEGTNSKVEIKVNVTPNQE